MPALLDRPTLIPDPPVVPAQADPDELVLAVRQDHIDRGIRSDSKGCAIVLAAKEATGDRWVSMGRTVLTANGSTWNGGEDVAEFTYAFDSGQRVYPDRFVFKRQVLRSDW
jgi:hypothetical protein